MIITKKHKAPGLISALCIITILTAAFSCGESRAQSFNFDYRSEDVAKYVSAPDITSVVSEELENCASSIAAGSVLYGTDGSDKLILPGDRLFFKYELSAEGRTESGEASLAVGDGSFCRGFDGAITYLTLTMGEPREITFTLEEGFSAFEKGERVNISITPTLVVPRHVYEAVTFYAAQDEGALLQDRSTRGTAEFGDTVRISYRIFYEGSVIAEESGRSLVVGSLSFSDVFEKAVIGLAEGESTKVRCRAESGFAPSEYAGKDVEASITLDGIDYRTFDDEMANSIGYPSADAYKDEYDRNYLMANALWNALTARAAVRRYPKGVVDYYTEWYISSFKELYRYYSEVYGQMFSSAYPTFEDFIVGFAGFSSMDEFNEEADADAKRNAFTDLLTFSYALEYGIELTDGEYAVGAAKTAADYNYRSVDELIADGYSEYRLRAELLKEKVMTGLYAVYSGK
ncbi:MAG: FKBP-type peptidyl-prolyl cis-trans isomerase, partial [Clostridia bacterium]|nr:FKBP-type peptidyl-prolyl cis-trans isomerase [Clostridia bacterium]